LTIQKTPTTIVIFGASSLGKELLVCLQEWNKNFQNYQILGFIDDDKKIHNKIINGFPVIGGISWFNKKNKDIACIVALGDSKTRKKIILKLKKFKVKFPTIIHPEATVSKFAKIGKGTIIQQGCIISPDSKIGNYSFLNWNVTLGSDSTIGNFVTIAPGVHVSAENQIGDEVFIGIGSVIKEGIKIEENSVIGAGTTVVKNVLKNSLCIGIPGKTEKKRKEHVFE
jgi:sugar O-acyltransferase (sialic acid O-acetyltransferase NeuD family)